MFEGFNRGPLTLSGSLIFVVDVHTVTFTTVTFCIVNVGVEFVFSPTILSIGCSGNTVAGLTTEFSAGIIVALLTASLNFFVSFIIETVEESLNIDGVVAVTVIFKD